MALVDWKVIEQKAIEFSKNWNTATNEKQQAQSFMIEFYRVFGVDIIRANTFEYKAVTDGHRNGFMDSFWKGRILIEMKSRGCSLDKAYYQAKDYAFTIQSDEDLPKFIMVCDFESVRLYNMTTGQQWDFKVKDLRKHVRKFSILTDNASKFDFVVDRELNTQAAYKMAKLHDELKANHYQGHMLEVYLVRLLFCLFSDDTGIFVKSSFHEYIHQSRDDGSDLSGKLMYLFEVLNTPQDNRQVTSDDLLKAFPYVNGGLFKEVLRPAYFNGKMRALLLECCESDWSGISPSIFGSMFQGVMNEQERHDLGAHYTSEQNILKVIKPLFLDDFYAEFERIKYNRAQLEYFHKKIASLNFLDPACGCGNFLIITYRELRLLELEVLKELIDNQPQIRWAFKLEDMILCNVNQFYGLEYEEFPCEIAKVGLWLLDHLMNNIIAEHYGMPFVRLPLSASATIYNGNALAINWEDIIPKADLSYILGNPPFLGYSNQSEEQKQDMLRVFLGQNGRPIKTAGKIDYVAGWYHKAAQYIQNTGIRCAFVSTNSITQGEQVASIWGTLMPMFHIKIDFAYRTFKWGNDAKGNAAVHCVIIGFSLETTKVPARLIYEEDGRIEANHINPYLVDADNVFVTSRSKPLCKVPPMVTGNRPVDGGNLIIEGKDYQDFVNKEPSAVKYIKRLIGAKEFINNIDRYCLWLVGVSPKELRQMPLVMERIEKTRQSRLSSPDAGARELADTPSLFRETLNPDNAIVIPYVSSETRHYVPIGFIDSEIIVTDQIRLVPDASLCHFGVLTSNVHNAWMRAICGRLKSDYRYSKDIIYNNFPWPDADEQTQDRITRAATAVLDARACYPDSSLADLYNPTSMPPELHRAHKQLDKEVWKAYKADWKSEAECVADLLTRYKALVEKELETA